MSNLIEQRATTGIESPWVAHVIWICQGSKRNIYQADLHLIMIMPCRRELYFIGFCLAAKRI
jgi:hypothetical protein